LTNGTVSGTIGLVGAFMERTNTNDFRSNLKEWMETARSGPIKITRKSGESFVLVNAEVFEGLQIELANLRGIAQGLSDVVQGRTRLASSESTNNAIERAKERVLGKELKKAVG
jgi:prevent-host-death family protein